MLRSYQKEKTMSENYQELNQDVDDRLEFLEKELKELKVLVSELTLSQCKINEMFFDQLKNINDSIFIK